MKESLQIHPSDTVAVALRALPGIPAGHKFALRDIAEGEDVIKYGYPIGHATRAIAKGELVDHHNIKTNLSGALDYSGLALKASGNASLPLQGDLEGSSFLGYLRSDGQVGIRNDIWVIPTVGCVNGICRQIVERAEKTLSPLPRNGESLAPLDNCAPTTPLPDERGQGVGLLYFPHNYGCSQLGDDHENTRKILRDMVLHPNAGGVLVVGLGCENNQPRDFEKMLGDYDRERIRFLICQEVEGDEVEAGVAIVKELYEQAQTYERVQVPLSKLRVGLKCGGSDGFSGITANPLLGAFTDWLCKEQGGTAVLTEVPEMFGAETILMRRAVSEEVLQQTISLVNNSPGNDLVASTALAAAGCQIVLFTTGRGTPFSTFVPTLKVSTNSELARRKPQWIDFNAGVLLEDVSMDELLQRFVVYVIDVLSGRKRTTAEIHGNAEFAIFKTGVTL